MESRGPNAEQIDYWNRVGGDKWVDLQAMLDAQLDDLGRVAMDAVHPRPGERVIDVGCGCGQTTLDLAERVGPDGHVLGIDVSEPMLRRTRERVLSAGHEHVQLVLDDAQTHAFAPATSDAVFSRFGVMFFADPAGAFANLRRALRPDGRLGFVCWQPFDRNPWMAVPAAAAARHVALPAPPAPDAPGPFALGDHDRLVDLLGRGGFVDVEVRSHETMLTLGGTAELDATVEFALRLGRPIAAALETASAAVVERVRDAVREALAAWHGPQGVRMPAAAWVVRGTRA